MFADKKKKKNAGCYVSLNPFVWDSVLLSRFFSFGEGRCVCSVFVCLCVVLLPLRKLFVVF